MEMRLLHRALASPRHPACTCYIYCSHDMRNSCFAQIRIPVERYLSSNMETPMSNRMRGSKPERHD